MSIVDANQLLLWIESYKEEKHKVGNAVDITIVGGTKTRTLPKFNFALLKQQPDSAPEAVHVGSGALVRVNDDIFAVTAGHIVEAGSRRYLGWLDWNNLRERRNGLGLDIGLELEANYYERDVPDSVDLAVFAPDTDLENLSRSAILPMKREELDEYVSATDESFGVVFGWGIAHREGLFDNAELHHAVMELEPLAPSSNIFTCRSFDERGPCEFDSGAPLVVPWKGEVRLAGIVLGTHKSGRWCHSHEFPCNFLAVGDLLEPAA